MTTGGVIIVLIMLLLVPGLLGLAFCTENTGFPLAFVEGYLLLFAAFEVVSLPFIISESSLSSLLKILVPTICVLMLMCLMIFVIRLIKKGPIKISVEPLTRNEMIYLGIFLALLLFQIYKAVFYVYGDGDDAFYISAAQVADQSDEMYLRDPYKGEATLLNFRYALAPFPMWIASMARLSGLKSATVAHIFVAPVLILVTYILYAEIGKHLFKESKEKRYMFLSLIAVFVIFSNYSSSTAETFLLTRSRQGKAALANIVFPFLFLLMLKMAERINEIRWSDTFILFITAMAAGLMSLFGNFLCPLMLLLFVIYALIKGSKLINIFKLLVPMIPNGCLLLMYFILR